jgi:hypothetical protein
MGDGLMLLPEQQRFEQLCRRVTSALTGIGVKPEALLATLPEARKRVFRRQYGGAASKPSDRPRRRGRAGQ